jgi:hypothetical protein
MKSINGKLIVLNSEEMDIAQKLIKISGSIKEEPKWLQPLVVMKLSALGFLV